MKNPLISSKLLVAFSWVNAVLIITMPWLKKTYIIASPPKKYVHKLYYTLYIMNNIVYDYYSLYIYILYRPRIAEAQYSFRPYAIYLPDITADQHCASTGCAFTNGSAACALSLWQCVFLLMAGPSAADWGVGGTENMAKTGRIHHTQTSAANQVRRNRNQDQSLFNWLLTEQI